MAPQGALDGSSGRTAGRPARDLGGQLLRVGVAVVAGSRLWEPSCSRLGTARRCEPPPAPRVPTLGARGAQHPTPAGVPESARKNACCWRTGGQPGWCGTPKAQLRKPSEDTSSLAKNVWDGGGSHRRSRAASTAALMDVATETPLTPAPARVRSSQGEEQLPHALCRPVSGSSDTPNSCLVGEVCWVLPLGSAVFFVGSYTEVEPAQASGSPTLAWGAGRTDGGRPSHEEHARRQTRRIPGPHPH